MAVIKVTKDEKRKLTWDHKYSYEREEEQQVYVFLILLVTSLVCGCHPSGLLVVSGSNYPKNNSEMKKLQ